MNKIILGDVTEILKGDVNWQDFDGKAVVVTGATGMIGQYLIHTFVGLKMLKGYDIKICAVCRSSKKALDAFGDDMKHINVVLADVGSESQLELIEEADYIFHAASPANPKFYSEDPVGTIVANSMGTRNMLEVARKYNSKFCYISTMEVYGQMNENNGITEESYGNLNFLDLRSCYPESKRLGENLCVAYNSQYGVDVKIIRPAFTYGPGMSLDDTRVQCEFMRSVLNDKDIVMKSDGSMRRTYTYVADVVSGIFYAVTKGNDLVYNVANEESIISIKELAEYIIAARENTKSELVMEISSNSGWSKVAPKIMDCSRLAELGWVALYGAEDGIGRTMEFHEENRK